jgi:hypothetical protein
MKTATWKTTAVAAAAFAAIALSVPAFAAATATKAHGKITDVSATSITVTPKNGTPSTFTINASTKITIDKAPATATDLKVGQRAGVKSDDGTVATAISVMTHRKTADPTATPAPAAPAAPATPAAPAPAAP